MRNRRLIAAMAFVAILCSGAAFAVAPKSGAVASAHYLATEAGIEVLNQGGNAFDAAVAVSAALAVVEPASSGMGGGGFWLLHRAKDGYSVMVDGRERAPAAATRDMYVKADGTVDRMKAVSGPTSAGIPGQAAALDWLAGNMGNLSLAQSLAPAIRLARDGFPADEKYVALLGSMGNKVRFNDEARKNFLDDGDIPELGYIVRQPDLAAVLERLAAKGKDSFYTGEFAELLVQGVRDGGGIWTTEDLAEYEIALREPIVFEYGPYKVTTAPPPSSGGIALATMLNVLEHYTMDALDEPVRIHLIVEAMRRAYRDRSIYLGDPDFVKIPTDLLIDDRYAAGLRASIRLDKATSSEMLPGIEAPPESTDTTHFSVIDKDGNRVAATLTINLPYGAGFVAPGTGFLLNDEMDDFSSKEGVPNAYGLIGADANAIEPGKRPLSSMTPTLIEGPDRIGVLGTPGGSRIITMVLLGLLEFTDGKDPEAWVSRPRFHHQYLPDQISIEPDAFGPELIEALEAMGHEVSARSRTWGNMHGVLWNTQTGEVKAASDPRWPSGRGIVQ